MNYKAIEAQHTVNGRDAEVHVLVNDAEYNTFWITQFEATSGMDVLELERIGARSDAVAPGKLQAPTVNMTGYFGSRIFLDVMENYKNTGKYPNIDFLIIQEDPNSDRGRQVTKLNGVFITDFTINTIDSGSEALTSTTNFRCKDWTVLEKFNYIDGERL